MSIKSRLSDHYEELFWIKVQKTEGCWEWLAAKNEQGYGVFGVGKDTDKAHRISWRLLRGEIPEGICICHACDNPGCVNPGHLFLGTRADNNADMTLNGRRVPPQLMGGWNKKILTKECENLLGKKPDYMLGKEFGVSKEVIARSRKQRGIPSYAESTGNWGMFKSGAPHPRWG